MLIFCSGVFFFFWRCCFIANYCLENNSFYFLTYLNRCWNFNKSRCHDRWLHTHTHTHTHTHSTSHIKYAKMFKDKDLLLSPVSRHLFCNDSFIVCNRWSVYAHSLNFDVQKNTSESKKKLSWFVRKQIKTAHLILDFHATKHKKMHGIILV